VSIVKDAKLKLNKELSYTPSKLELKQAQSGYSDSQFKHHTKLPNINIKEDLSDMPKQKSDMGKDFKS
jgi:hypothetical protein